jgi:Malectin domain
LIPVLAREVPPDAERDRKLLESYRAAGGGRLLPYLEGRVLQRAGKPEEAAAKFTEALALDGAAHEPALRHAECLRAAGSPADAEEALRRTLAGPRGARSEPWDLWLAISFLDLKRSPAEMLARLPRREGPLDGGYAEDVRWLLETLEARVPVRIDCGAVEERPGKGGEIWSRDRFFRSGCRFGEEMWGLVPASRIPPYPGEISGTEDDFVHQTERSFSTDEIPPAGYRIPIPPGRYAVTLHFAELYYTKRRSRYFDILLEGRRVLASYEPLAVGYTTADSRSFEVEVSDGALEIEFLPKAQFPKLSAIEVAGKE